MLELFKAGGWPMFAVLLMATLALASAVHFAVRPQARAIGMIRGFSTASVFAVLGGITMDLATVFSRVPSHPEWSQSDDMPLIVMTGISESMSPAILGFNMLALVWLVTAVGVRRLGDQEVAATPARKAD